MPFRVDRAFARSWEIETKEKDVHLENLRTEVVTNTLRCHHGDGDQDVAGAPVHFRLVGHRTDRCRIRWRTSSADF